MGGSLTYDEIEYVYDKYPNLKNIKNFVETGTYKGDTCIPMSFKFENVYTIEIVKELYNYARNKAIDSKAYDINFYLGDSVEILKHITNLVRSGAVFFIDAHQSGPDTSNNQKQHVPLIEELEVILSSNITGNSVFIFDDLRFFNGNNKPWDWEHISIKTILDMFAQWNYNIIETFVRNDRLFIII